MFVFGCCVGAPYAGVLCFVSLAGRVCVVSVLAGFDCVFTTLCLQVPIGSGCVKVSVFRSIFRPFLCSVPLLCLQVLDFIMLALGFPKETDSLDLGTIPGTLLLRMNLP